MKKTNPWKAMLIVGALVVVLSVVDGFTNFVANIPIIGGLLASLGNTVMEVIDIILGSYLIILGVRR